MSDYRKFFVPVLACRGRLAFFAGIERLEDRGRWVYGFFSQLCEHGLQIILFRDNPNWELLRPLLNGVGIPLLLLLVTSRDFLREREEALTQETFQRQERCSERRTNSSRSRNTGWKKGTGLSCVLTASPKQSFHRCVARVRSKRNAG
jgi:hypothetical protein